MGTMGFGLVVIGGDGIPSWTGEAKVLESEALSVWEGGGWVDTWVLVQDGGSCGGRGDSYAR